MSKYAHCFEAATLKIYLSWDRGRSDSCFFCFCIRAHVRSQVVLGLLGPPPLLAAAMTSSDDRACGSAPPSNGSECSTACRTLGLLAAAVRLLWLGLRGWSLLRGWCRR